LYRVDHQDRGVKLFNLVAPGGFVFESVVDWLEPGIVGFNKIVDLEVAKTILEEADFVECIIAPSYAADALEALSKKKNLRLFPSLTSTALLLPVMPSRQVDRLSSFGKRRLKMVMGHWTDLSTSQEGLTIPEEWKLMSLSLISLETCGKNIQDFPKTRSKFFLMTIAEAVV